MPGVSSMNSGASRSSSQIIWSCLISCSLSMPRRSRWESTRPRLQRIRWATCWRLISIEKKTTGWFSLTAMYSARLSPSAVLPMEGRAATMMSSPACRPLVMSSSSRKPVARPVR